MKAKEIRAEARDNMSGKWGKFIGMNFVVLAITIIACVIAFIPMFVSIGNSTINNTLENLDVSEVVLPGLLTYLIIIVLMIFIVPLTYSFLENIVKLKRDEKTKCMMFLKNIFKNFGRSWKVSLWIIVKILLLYLIFVLALIVTLGLFVIAGILNSNILICIALALLVISMVVFYILFIIRTLSMILSQYLAIDFKEFTAKQSVEKSINLMKGYKWKFVCLTLSFIGWILLSYLTFGMGFVFLIPYMQVSYICFYENILKEKGINIPE